MSTYRTTDIVIGKGHVLFPWCDTLTAKGNNLVNATRFRQRQVLTASDKKPEDWTRNESDIIDEFVNTGIFSRENICSTVSYTKLEKLMKLTRNPDYFAEGLPRQSAQQVIRQAVTDMESFFKAMASYKEDPSRFTGKPELPGYKRKGGHCTVPVTNQDCTIVSGENGMLFAKLPYAKKTPLCIGSPKGQLKEVQVVPVNGIYKICFTFEVESDIVPLEPEHRRMCSVDMGVDNLMAVTNNCGLPCLLYKGGIIKSVNHYYNKKIAGIVSVETKKPGCPKGKDGLPKFHPTDESMAVTRRRNDSIRDYMHKTAKHFITWCVENRIDTIVVGVNRGWKQSASMGSVNNQNFVQIPFYMLRGMISYLAEEHGISYIEQEESYTSKASFLDRDEIPVYGVNDKDAVFSGRRRPTRYKGMYRASGFRGLYKSSDGTVINSDLNGSANILRKAFPDAFDKEGTPPDFGKVLIFKNVELEFILYNRKKQTPAGRTLMSRAKSRRMKRKLA